MDEMDDCFSAFFSYFCRKSKKVAHAFVCFHILFKFAVLERKCSCTSPGRHTLEVFRQVLKISFRLCLDYF